MLEIVPLISFWGGEYQGRLEVPHSRDRASDHQGWRTRIVQKYSCSLELTCLVALPGSCKNQIPHNQSGPVPRSSLLHPIEPLRWFTCHLSESKPCNTYFPQRLCDILIGSQNPTFYFPHSWNPLINSFTLLSLTCSFRVIFLL